MVDEIDASSLADAMVVDSDMDDEMDEVDDTEDKTDQDDSDDKKEKKAAQDADGIKTLRTEFKQDMTDFKKTAEGEKKDLQKEISRLGFALRKAEKGKKEDDVFTDAQLQQMMDDHQDEPKVLFQVMKQMAKQSGDSATQNAESKVKIMAKHKELTDMAEKTFPGGLKEGSPLYSGIQETMEHLGLTDHPYGDVLGMAVMTLKNLPNFYKNVQEKTRKDSLGKAADDKRKDKIKTDKLADKGTQLAMKTLSSDDGETMKRLGLKSKRQKELYQKFRGAGKKAATVQAEA
jgi:hypothetical protein